jgi:hypothetical protein
MDAIAPHGVAIGREVAPFASRGLAIRLEADPIAARAEAIASEGVAFDLGKLPCEREVAAIWSHARAFASRDGAMRSGVWAIGLEGRVDRPQGAACRLPAVAIRFHGGSFDPRVGAIAPDARTISRDVLPIRPEERRSGAGTAATEPGRVALNCHLRRTT